MEILKTKSIKTAVELLNAAASELQLEREGKLSINCINGKMFIVDGERWEVLKWDLDARDKIWVDATVDNNYKLCSGATRHFNGSPFYGLDIQINYDSKYKGIILSSDNQKVLEAVNVFFTNTNKPLLVINQETENQKIEAEINKVTNCIGKAAKTEINKGEVVTYCGYFVLAKNYQNQNKKIENLLKNHNVVKSGLIEKKEINNKYVDFGGFVVQAKYLKLAFKLLGIKKAVFDVIKLKGGGSCLKIYSPDNIDNFVITTFCSEAKIKEILIDGNTTITKIELQVANSEPAAIEKKEVAPVETKATKKVAEKKEVAKVEKKATKATAKTEVQENATTVEELTDCNIALECYEVGNIMQPPTIASGGSLRGYKVKKAAPVKAKKSEPAPAPVKSEFDFATVATLDSLELFARRERNFATAAAICRKYGATMEIKGVWLWFGDCEDWDEWSTELLAAGIATHFAVEKKQDCWHEPEDGSGFGKTEQTAEQITKKYGCITAA